MGYTNMQLGKLEVQLAMQTIAFDHAMAKSLASTRNMEAALSKLAGGKGGRSLGSHFNQTTGSIRRANLATNGMLRTVQRLDANLRRISLIQIGGLLARGFSMAGAAIGGVFRASSDLYETLSKVDAVFGPGAKTIISAADQMAAKFGIVKNEFLEGAARFGMFGKTAGMAREEAARMGVTFAKLAVDLSSFMNVSNEEAIRSISSGLSGEIEPLRRFGVFLSDAAVKAEAARMGLAKLGGTLTEQQKIQVRMRLITKGLADAQGDLARTANSPANQFRKLQGTLANVAAAIGAGITPAFKALLTVANGIGARLTAFFADNKGGFAAWSESVNEAVGRVIARVADLASSFGAFLGSESGKLLRDGIRAIGGAFAWLADAIGSAVETIAFTLRNWDAIAEIAVLKVSQSFTDAGSIVSWLGQVFLAFGEWLGSQWLNLITDALTAATRVIENFIGVVTNEFKQIKGLISDPLHFKFDASKFNPFENMKKMMDMGGEQFKTEQFKTPELKMPDVTGARIAELEDQIGKAEAKRTEDKAKEPKPLAELAAKDRGERPQDEAVTKEKKAKGGGSMGLEEFAKHLQAAALGSQDKHEATTAKNTGRMAEGLDRLNQNVERGFKNPGVAVGPA